MGFDQYHEPPNELPEETRTFARMILSPIEEAQAIDWYERRRAVESDAQAKAIMQNAQKEEFKHFGMDLEFLLRKNRSGGRRCRASSSPPATSSRKARKRKRKPIRNSLGAKTFFFGRFALRRRGCEATAGLSTAGAISSQIHDSVDNHIRAPSERGVHGS
jgi:hypothetical protein